MAKQILLYCFLLLSINSMAITFTVKNQGEFDIANTKAQPGDVLILKNGMWNDVSLIINLKGTKEKPIIVKAETDGKVVITGNSKLKIGGTYIVVDGLYFTNGYSGSESVITFKSGNTDIANNCRVTNTLIDNFNNTKRLEDNYWISFYGKNNRLDHCSFLNKKNIGVLVAIILEDDRSRENFHSIDHNYFGIRIPLASNAGEIIRVGVSEHCQYNSNTQITNNLFEHCDGETEIISIKSCKNSIRNNVFKECQGSVVLRHGNYNTVENNIFLGNNKTGSGGVRIINKGQWVINNLFYKCRGEGFRSPLTLMNGVPNSPANRYLEVSEAVVCNNSFYECTPISFCEGSDAERSVQPHDVQFLNNLFLNTKDSQLYNVYDKISGISFGGNYVSKSINQNLIEGFTKTSLSSKALAEINVPDIIISGQATISDSLILFSAKRQTTALSSIPGWSDSNEIQNVINNAKSDCGTNWQTPKSASKTQTLINCNSAEDVIKSLVSNTNTPLSINLTGKNYVFNAPLNIEKDISITTSQTKPIKFSFNFSSRYCIQLKAGFNLEMSNLFLELESIDGKDFITTDTSGNSNHSNFSLTNCTVNKCNGNFFTSSKSSLCDSILITNCNFKGGDGVLFNFIEETDNKGYYNVEKLKISNNNFDNYNGQILNLIRSGKDESTMGPLLVFSKNNVNNCSTEKNKSLINLYGVQQSYIEFNTFNKSNDSKALIVFDDTVRAIHYFRNNAINGSGNVVTNKYVTAENNRIQ